LHFRRLARNIDIASMAAVAAGVEDDPVVKEYKIRLVFPPQGSFEYIQFPVPTPIRNDDPPVSVAIRPEQTMMEIEYGTEDWQKTEFYDPEFARKGDFAPGHKRKFTSTKVSLRTQYVFAQENGDEFLISPVSNVLAMRPDFSHVNRKLDEEEPDATLEVDGQLEQDSQSKGLRVQIQKLQSSRSLEAKERSFMTLQENKAAEAWVPMDVAEPVDSGTGLKNILGSQPATATARRGKNPGLSWSVGPSEYLQSMVPDSKEVFNDDSDYVQLSKLTAKMLASGKKSYTKKEVSQAKREVGAPKSMRSTTL
jgi:hypothetical protein